MADRKIGLVVIAAAVLIVLIVTTTGRSSSDSSQLDWAKLNPAFAGATFAKDREVCAACHQEAIDTYSETTHGQTLSKTHRGELESLDCEACHGPRSKHVEAPDSGLAIPINEYSAVCLQCHQDSKRLYWQSGLHSTADVGCISCHSVMDKRSPTALLSARDQSTVCSGCHTDVKAKMNRLSRHPLQEGSVDCSSCHNPHGTPGQGMLAKGSVSETCYGCHQDKRGPFLWEHAPVREDCMTCHEPHGTNNRSLLITQSSSMCVSCHQYGGHVNQYRYNRVSTPYGNGCVNCHVTIHGSNHPSGAKFTR